PARIGWVMAQAAILGFAVFLGGQAFAVPLPLAGVGVQGQGGGSGTIDGRHYTTVIACVITLTAGSTTPAGNVTIQKGKCKQFFFTATFQDTSTSPPTTFNVDVTHDIATTWQPTSDETCIQSQGGGLFCAVAAHPPCTATITAIFTF